MIDVVGNLKNDGGGSLYAWEKDLYPKGNLNCGIVAYAEKVAKILAILSANTT